MHSKIQRFFIISAKSTVSTIRKTDRYDDPVGTKINGTLEKYGFDPLECNLRQEMNAETEP